MFEQSWTGVFQNIDTTRIPQPFIGETFPIYPDTPEYGNYPKIKKSINVPFTTEETGGCVSVTETCGQRTVAVDEGLLDIIEIPIDLVQAKQGGLFFELAQEAGIKYDNAEQLRNTILESLDCEISKAGLQLTDDAKQAFVDTLLLVMKKTDQYLKEKQ